MSEVLKQNALFKLMDSPPKLPGNHPKPIYYYDEVEKKEYLILTPHFYNKTDVYKYDIINNKYSILCSYPEGLEPNCHGTFLMPNTNKLYFYGGFRFESPKIGILDLQTLEWDVLSNDGIYKFKKIDTVSFYNHDADNEQLSYLYLEQIQDLHVYTNLIQQIINLFYVHISNLILMEILFLIIVIYYFLNIVENWYYAIRIVKVIYYGVMFQRIIQQNRYLYIIGRNFVIYQLKLIDIHDSMLLQLLME